MNQVERGFCQHCHAFVEVVVVEIEHDKCGAISAHGDACLGQFHQPAVLVFGPG